MKRWKVIVLCIGAAVIIFLSALSIYSVNLYKNYYHGTATVSEIKKIKLEWSYGLDYPHIFDINLSDMDPGKAEEFVDLLNECSDKDILGFLYGHFAYLLEIKSSLAPTVTDGGGSFEGTITLSDGTTWQLEPAGSYPHRTWLDGHNPLPWE